jgi:hypothetical protein
MSAALTSVIVVSFNTSELTLKLLRSLKNLESESEIEVIVVDNKSEDDSVLNIKAEFPDSKLIENDRNLGFGKAVNQAAAQARGKYLWLLNSDCYLKQPILKELVNLLEAADSAFAVTPKTVTSQGRFHSPCRRFPTYQNIIFSRGSLLAKLPFWEDRLEDYTYPDFEQPTRVEAISGTAMLMRREEFLDTGGFDERFFMYHEDTDLCYRMYLRQRFCYYFPQAEIEHVNKASSKGRQTSRLYHHHRSTMEYFLKWYPHNYPHNFLLIILLTINLIVKIILVNAGLLSDNSS